MPNDVQPTDVPNDNEVTAGPRTVRTLMVLVTLLLLLVSAYLVVIWRNHSKTPAGLTIEVNALPADSEVLIDGAPAGKATAGRALQPGTHELFVSRNGYHSWHQTVVVSGSLKIPVTLQPIPMDLRITTGQSKPEVWMDDQPMDNTHDVPGELTVTGVSEKTHTLRIKSAAGETTLSFDFQYGNAPVAVLPQTGPTLLFVSSFAGKVMAACNCKAQLQLGDSTQSLEPGTPASFMLADGKYMAELKGLSVNGKSGAVVVGPSPAATLAIFQPTSGEKAAPNIQTLLNNAMNQLKDSKCDFAQSTVDQILSKDPENVDAISVSRRITRLRSVGGCM